MSRLTLAIDLGTSGFRAQGVDLRSGEILSTAITPRHPLPGSNVIDHLDFALEIGTGAARGIILRAIRRIAGALGVPLGDVERIAVCGNPVQLSLFQGSELRDLAYAGKRKLEALGVMAPPREGSILPASQFSSLGLPENCEVIIPPAVRQEVGADALALVLKSGMLDRDETSIAIDYGTNAEMILSHAGKTYVGSTAAGPALEGQQISCGTLAVPGAIADLEREGGRHRLVVLDEDLFPARGETIDLRQNDADAGSKHRSAGVTCTGTIAAVEEAIEAGLAIGPRILTDDHRLHLGPGVSLTEKDLIEAGKAVGAVRAGYLTLCQEAGIGVGDISAVYMAGAAGTYVDARKARNLGLLPPAAKTVYHMGNTSLAMARDLALAPERLGEMKRLARTLRTGHVAFAESAAFRWIYLLELSHWTEGMPLSLYRSLLRRNGLRDLPPVTGTLEIVRRVRRDIEDHGRAGLKTVAAGDPVEAVFEGCNACGKCAADCPEKALTVAGGAGHQRVTLYPPICLGVTCKRCERACPEKVLRWNGFFRDGEASTVADACSGNLCDRLTGGM